MFRASICPSSEVYKLYTTAYGVQHCPKHVELFMIINKIVASSWDLSSFSYMMHGNTYIKFT